MRIRLSNNKDITDIFLKREWNKINIKNGVSWKKHKNYICVLDGDKLVGCSKINIYGGICKISQIIIKENYRNRGIGGKLLKAIETFAKKNKCHKTQLFTSRLNGKALEFYLRNGYNIKCELKDDIFHNTNYLLI